MKFRFTFIAIGMKDEIDPPMHFTSLARFSLHGLT